MNIHDFFFISDLSEERKQQILNWVHSLPEDNRRMVEELRHDATEEAVYFENETEDC